MSSNVVDSKIVELSMRNENFESNAVKSLSTLDKLKKALDFKGEYRGIDGIGDSIKRVNIGALTSGVETLKTSLSGLGRIAAFSMIADEAIKAKNAVEGFVKEVTVGQVSAGWDKYAQKTSAVQTIMAATAKDFSDTGEQMEFVNAQMDKLNWFTDETSYNFVDMVSNIGKFTSNNIKLDDAVTAMQGISTWAAKSGAGVNEASRAMYNLSQAIGTGSVQIRDWFSIENANMATAEFKQTVIDTAESMGLLEKATDDTWKTLKGHEVTVASFRENLSDDWFSSEVLVKSLERYGKFTDELYRVMSNMNEGVLTSDMFRYIEQFKDGTIDLAAVSKETGLSIKDLQKELSLLGSEEMEFGLKALKAAQEAKTFQEAVDSVKDAVSTGWMNTFELMFGDYVQAKELWTDLANNLYDIFAEGGNARNALIKEAFDHESALNQSDWDKLTESGLASPEFIKAFRKAAGEHGRGVNEMIDDQEWLRKSLERGLLQYEDLQTAFEQGFDTRSEMTKQIASLKEADDAVKGFLNTIDKYDGDDLSKVIFGDGKYEEGYEELERALDGLITSLGLEQSEGQKVIDSLLEMRGVTKNTADEWQNLTDAQLRQRGMTDEEIKQFREAESAGNKYAKVLEDIKNSHKSGGELWTESLYNSMETLLGLIDVFREAWANVFPEASATQVYDFLSRLNALTTSMVEFVSTSTELRDIAGGLVSAFDIFLQIVSTLGQGAFGILNGVLDGLGINLLDIAASIGRTVTGFRDWLADSQILARAMSIVVDLASSAARTVRSWIDSFLRIPFVSRNLAQFRGAFSRAIGSIGPYLSDGVTRIAEFIERLKSLDGFSIDNLKTAFTDFKDNVLGYFINFPGFKAIKSAVDILVNDIKDQLRSMGVDVEFLENVFSFFKDNVVTFFGSIGTAVGNGITTIKNWFKSILEIPIVAQNLGRFQRAFDIFFGSFGDGFSGLKAAVQDFMDRVSALGGIRLDNLGDIFDTFKDTIGKFFTQDWHGFDGFKIAFKWLGEDIKVILSGMTKNITSYFTNLREQLDGTLAGDILGWIMDKVSAIVDSIGKLFNGDVDLKDGISGFVSSINGIFESVVDFVSKISPGKMLKIGSGILGVVTAIKAIKSLIDFITAPKTIAKKIGNVFDTISDTIGSFSKKGSTNANNILKIAAAVGILAFSLAKLSTLDTGKMFIAVGAIAALGVVLLALSGALSFLKKIGLGGDAAGSLGLLFIAAAIWVLADAVKQLQGFDGTGLDNALAAVEELAAIITIMNVVSAKAGAGVGSGVSLIAAAASIIILVQALKQLTKIDAKGVSEAMDAMLDLALIVTLMTAVSAKAGAGLGSGVSLIASAASILILVQALKQIAEIGNAGELDDALKAVEDLALIVTLMTAVSAKAGAGIGSGLGLVLSSASIMILAEALSAIASLPTEGVESGKAALEELMAFLAILDLVAAKAGGINPSVLILGVMVGVLGYVLYQLASLPSENLESAAISLAVGMGTLMGALVVCAIVGHFAYAAEAGLLLVGEVLAVLAVVILALAGISALVSLFGGDFDAFLTTGIDLLVKIGDGIGRAIGALVSGFGEAFGDSLASITEGISNFATMLGEIGAIEIDTEGLSALVESISAISFAGLVTAIENQVAEWVTGKTAMETFTESMSQLSTALLKWKIQMTLIGNITVPTEAINSLVAALDAVPNSGLFQSIASFFTGAPDLEAFSTNLGQLGAGLSAFKTAVGDDLDATELNEMASAINVLGELGNVLKGQDFGGWFSKNDYTQFGTSLVGFGEKLQEFTAIEIDTEKLSSVATASNTLATMGTTLSTIDLSSGDIASADTIATFVANLQTLSDSISGLASIDTSGVTSLSTAVTSLNAIDLSSALKKPSETDTDFTASGTTAMTTLSAGITASSGSVSSAITDVMSSAASAAGAQSAAFTTQGQTLINALAHGIAQNGGIVTAAVQTVASNAASAAGGYSGQFVNAGFQMAAGLAGGISAGASMAIAAAISMAAAALAAAKAVLAVHSPSRETYALGEFFGLGFTNAISDHTGVAYDTAAGMAGAARQGLDDAVQGIRDALTSDIDANPVIRPVLDLTEIQNGANSMSDMLAINKPIGLVGNINAISSNMNSRNRSGDELTMALKSLQRTMSNQRTGDTYNLNGITYDDGSNVATAVRQLVRAARVERRA